jgi:disulfide oxidoreductase YuzD
VVRREDGDRGSRPKSGGLLLRVLGDQIRKERVLIEVKVYGSEPPCAKCKQAEGEARKAAEKFPGQVSITKYSALLPEALQLGLMMTPAVVVNGKVISQGRVPKESELERIFRLELGG